MLFHSSVPKILAICSIAYAVESKSEECISHSLPNPIATEFPANVTGTVNATIAILPIPLSLARTIIPKQYAILTSQYRTFLPQLPKDMYPAILQTVRDHDIKFGEYGIPDFSRAAIDFPFIDLLHDGQTSFRWSPTMFISSDSKMAIEGASEYGTTVYPSIFDPPCNAYEHTESGETYLKIKGANTKDGVYIDTLFHSNEEMMSNPIAFPMQFFVNATNQPSFGDGKICDEYVRFFDRSISKEDYAAVPVSGSVDVKSNLFKDGFKWKNVVGVRVDSAFIEGHLVSCEGLRGYTGTGQQQVEIMKPSSKMDRFDWSLNSTFAPLYNLQSVIASYITPLTGYSG